MRSSHSRQPRSLLALSLLTAALLGACDTTTAPTAPTVAGTYVATTLAVTEDGTTVDLLQQGFGIELTLHPDNTTSGVFHFAFEEEPGDPAEDISLDGTWSLRRSGDETTVELDQPGADTFLRDVTFRVRGNQLEGSYQALRAVLTKR